MAKKTSAQQYQVIGNNANALFTLKAHRGEGAVLLAMNWKRGKPPVDFVGFSIEYKEPDGSKFFPIPNRLGFLDSNENIDPNRLSSLVSPIQKFRWVHFPKHTSLKGNFIYKVKPVFMNEQDHLSYGEKQEVEIEVLSETYPGQLNVSFTRGFVASQAFVDKFEDHGKISTLIPPKGKLGLKFKPSHPLKNEAYDWMGAEVYRSILDILDKAINFDKKAIVRVVAYDLNVPAIVDRLKKLGKRAQVIIDDSGEHGSPDSAETQAEKSLKRAIGANNVIRQHMGTLQHNKMFVVDGPKLKVAIGGSTNLSWRGFFVQSNNALIVYGAKAIKPFNEAFDSYWNSNSPTDFSKTAQAEWLDLGLKGIDARVTFSPHSSENSVLNDIANDIGSAESSVLYSLAFLFMTPGVVLDNMKKVTKDKNIFVYGISDKKVGKLTGIDVVKPDGNIAPVYPKEIKHNLIEPFKKEVAGGSGAQMHHKFVVIDFDKPNARVYLGSYNFSLAADTKNGENLLYIQDRKVATAYMIEALRLVDHYHFRVAIHEAKEKNVRLFLKKPPRKNGEKAWWDRYYIKYIDIKDREMFA